jgi:GT2 family glycosyltransferase
MQHSVAPRVAVVIPTWNGREDILRCLSSLPRLRYPNWTAIVVDNASTDGTRDAISEHFPTQRVLVMERNLGFCGGNNRGIATALEEGADYILLLNSDTEVHPGLLDELVQVAASDERIAGVGAKNLRMEDPSVIWGAYGRVTYGSELVEVAGKGEPDGPAYSTVRDVEWLIGNGMLMSRKALLEIGALDEQFFAYHEDVDWCLRARKHGMRIVYNGRAVILHKGFGTSDASRPVACPVLYFLGRNGLILSRKHGTRLQRIRHATLFLANVARLWVQGRTGREAPESYRWLLRGFYHGATGRLALRELRLQ